MPATVLFRNEWLDDVDVPVCPIKTFEQLLEQFAPPPAAIAFESTNTHPLARACVVPYAFIAPLMQKAFSPTQAWPILKAQAQSVDL
eukprot:3124595-Ditylum_brightwellii.AAC.1